MELKIGELKPENESQAIDFAIEGMHLDWYVENRFLLKQYGRYFWYLELTRATQAFAVYADDTFAGVMLAEFKGEKPKYSSFWKRVYVKLIDFIQHLVAGKGVGAYDNANKEMLDNYLKDNSPDGEIIFLASNPKVKTKGIGTLLLSELEKREKGKTVYLYTDNACTYQFYEHRGFDRVSEKDVLLDLGKKTVPLTCLLYSKTL